MQFDASLVLEIKYSLERHSLSVKGNLVHGISGEEETLIKTTLII